MTAISGQPYEPSPKGASGRFNDLNVVLDEIVTILETRGRIDSASSPASKPETPSSVAFGTETIGNNRRAHAIASIITSLKRVPTSLRACPIPL